MKKTIFILTTRSFHTDTLFNPGNCSPVEFRKDSFWYKKAFPQYFTDLIQFLDLYELQTFLEKYILEQLLSKIEKIADLEKAVGTVTRKHLKIYLREKEKGTGKGRKKQLSREESNKKLQALIAETAPDKEILIDKVKKKIQQVMDELKTKKLHNILINKSKEKTDVIIRNEIFNKRHPSSTLWEAKENIAVDIATEYMIKTLGDLIPSWWFSLLKNKNKYCYLNHEEAYGCYIFLQNHCSGLLQACDEAQRQSNRNQFSLDHLLYKYNTGETGEDWYIVKCFGMRTDPDFGLTYIISLIKEIEKRECCDADAAELTFQILIHDYDIGRKLIHSSVQLKLQTPFLKEIRISFAEKDMESILENQPKITLPPHSLQKYYRKEKFYLFLNLLNKLPSEPINTAKRDRYKAIEYIDQNKETIPKIERIIVFKHNKGEVAGLLKSKNVFALKYFILHKQAIIDRCYEIVGKADKLIIAYQPSKIISLISLIKEILKMIAKAEKAIGAYVPVTICECSYADHEKYYLAKIKENMTGLRKHLEKIPTPHFCLLEITNNINAINTFFQP